MDLRCAGRVPEQPHTAFRPDGELLYEHCITQRGFDGPYSILYQRGRPHAWVPEEAEHWFALPTEVPQGLLRRHYQTAAIPVGGAPIDARVPLLFNDAVVVSVLAPDSDDPVMLCNADGDDLFFVREGGGRLITALGTVVFRALDYVCIPRGLPYRFELVGTQHWLNLECPGGVHIQDQWRNDVGQLRMDAPFGHRDFRGPVLGGDTGNRVVVKRGGRWQGFKVPHSPVVGWEGTVYPWAMSITAFRPRVSSVHLPPTWHGTFSIGDGLVCSFVPRPVDFGEGAVPCPYPHSSVDIDEVLFYVDGDFTSRNGVGPGSLSHHPAGVPHGPHPGAYTRSIGTRKTDEMAVMLDVVGELRRTAQAVELEVQGYEASLLC